MPNTGRISVDGVVRAGGSRVSSNSVPMPAQSIHTDPDAGRVAGDVLAPPAETLLVGDGKATSTAVPRPSESVVITNT